VVEEPYRIIRRREVKTRPRLDEEVVSIRITYVAKDLPPGTIGIPSQEYSPEEGHKRILEDIERRGAERV